MTQASDIDLPGPTQNPEGFRDKKGEWRPAKPIYYAPIFEWPVKAAKFALWLINYLFTWNVFYFGVTLLTWHYFHPALERCTTFQAGWMFEIFARNMALLWIYYGGWHLYLYILKLRSNRGKYCPRWQSKQGSTFLFGNQVWDNIFWTCGSGCITWSAYEIGTMWMYANGHLPWIDFQNNPIAFCAVLFFIPFWREFHFYWIHRLIHWKPLYDRVHYLHHYNINPGPWSGMAMHPIEHILYFSVTLIHWIIPSHPILFLFNSQHTALTPAPTHTGFEGKLGGKVDFGSYFHYLHHRHFDCNYGESTIPLDRWFGSFENGARTESEKREARRTYYRYTVEQIEDESPEVKSFYLSREDGGLLEPALPGQHLMFKVPAGKEGRTLLRFYTLSDIDGQDYYRISVKREQAPQGSHDIPAGAVSNFLHDTLKPGDTIEARGPLGDFTPDLRSHKPVVLVSGGIGITPILAMLKGILRQDEKRKIHLFLAFRTPGLEVFRKEIDEVLEAYPNVSCNRFYDEVEPKTMDGVPNSFAGRIGIDFIMQEVSSPMKADYFICGPGPMMAAITSGLMEAGISDEQIHTESFTQGRSASGDGSAAGDVSHYQISFSRSGKSVTWDAEFKNLLEFSEDNDVAMESGCLFGECGACAVKLNQGEVEYPFTTAYKPPKGQCLPCSCRPKSDIVLEA